LFEDLSALPALKHVVLVEEYLFFKQYPFHKQKLAFHRASMKKYEAFLKTAGKTVKYIDAIQVESEVQKNISCIKTAYSPKVIHVFDLVDNWLEKRLKKACSEHKITLTIHPSPQFLTTKAELENYFAERKRFFQTDFYIDQRKKRKILVDGKNKPLGGKWSFDAENRKKYPPKKMVPHTSFELFDSYYQEAFTYVESHFSQNVGNLNRSYLYPTDFEQANTWFMRFLEGRFLEFGVYEDAIVARETVLHHSVLTPMLNAGLITPSEIVEKTLEYAANHDIPLNSLEGFIRQVVGWREFIRSMYELRGTQQRTTNYWHFSRPIPASFWTGTTGIDPIDQTIKKLQESAYCHHIERLMVLGNFMLLCEFNPDEVYEWFMVFFIDAYDWVMVPNVYGMSQFADGGTFATKPYISSSNYLLKMSDYKRGSWCETWDALFWNFMDKQRAFFLQNPRIGMLLQQFDNMPSEKQEAIRKTAREYLEGLGEKKG
jgi:deoxyribodipyrimidine photolyase-related protein